MTAEEAIEILNNSPIWDNLYPSQTTADNADLQAFHDAVDMAISTLEKQIAKKPMIVNGEFDDAITFEWKDYLCPVCKRTLISKCDGEWCAGRKVAHCECGQAICWEE